MMCLGWNNRPDCQARPPIQVTASAGGGLTPAGTSACGPSSALWFWLAAGAIVVGGVVKK